MKVTPTWQIIKEEIISALKSYEIKYNDSNTVPVYPVLEDGARRYEDPTRPDIVAIGYVQLTVKRGGNAHVLARKTFGFRHKQEANKEDWKLTLYREMLYEIVGTAIMHTDIMRRLEEERVKRN